MFDGALHGGRLLPMQPVIAASFGTWANVVVAGATIALFLAAIWAGRTAARQVKVAASGIDQQIAEQRRIELQRRAYAHLSTFSSRDFTEITIAADRVFKAFDKDVADGEAVWNEMDHAAQAGAITVINFYGLIATEYNAGWLDREIANPSVAYAAVVKWEQARKFIAWLTGSDPAYFAQWRRFYTQHSVAIIEAERKSR